MGRPSLLRRLKQVERTLAPPKDHRLVLLFEGPGSAHFPRLNEEEIGDPRGWSCNSSEHGMVDQRSEDRAVR